MKKPPQNVIFCGGFLLASWLVLFLAAKITAVPFSITTR